jgi:hypothetical protein
VYRFPFGARPKSTTRNRDSRDPLLICADRNAIAYRRDDSMCGVRWFHSYQT